VARRNPGHFCINLMGRPDMSQLIDKLPLWAKLICAIAMLVGSAYYIDRYGVVTFILKLIFSP
jgi:hypothetical protein